MAKNNYKIKKNKQVFLAHWEERLVYHNQYESIFIDAYEKIYYQVYNKKNRPIGPWFRKKYDAIQYVKELKKRYG